MKKTKKLAALVLAMVMAFSLMAVTAAAYVAEEHDCAVCSEETIQPRIPAMQCTICNVQMGTKIHTKDGQRMIDFLCPNNSDHNVYDIPW